MHGPTLKKQELDISGYVHLALLTVVHFWVAVNGHEIKWYHLILLYEKTQCDLGLYIGNKLKLDHLKLNYECASCRSGKSWLL
jgi:hypothetical protein